MRMSPMTMVAQLMTHIYIFLCLFLLSGVALADWLEVDIGWLLVGEQTR